MLDKFEVMGELKREIDGLKDAFEEQMKET